MEGGGTSGNDSSPKFELKMEEPQQAILAKNWGSFKRFFQNDKEAIMKPLDLYGNTAVHVAATRWNNPELLKELLNILPEGAERWRALRKRNAQKNTVLHQVIHCKNVLIVDAVLEYYKDLQVPQDEEEEDKDLPLLELVNDLGETPVYRAAKYGKLEMLKHMAKFVDIKNHLYRWQRKEEAQRDRTSILHIAIMGHYFGVALWLSKLEVIEEIAGANDRSNLSCLQLLSGMPSVFSSYDSQMGFTEKIIYACISDKRCEESYDDAAHHAKRHCLKSRTAKKIYLSLVLAAVAFGAVVLIDVMFPETAFILPLAIISVTISFRTAFAAVVAVVIVFTLDTTVMSPVVFIPSLALAAVTSVVTNIGAVWDRIEKISNKKKQHKLAERVANFLVKIDNSWMHSKHAKPQKEVVLPMTQLSNEAARKIARQHNEEGQSENPISFEVYTPLLLAASTGIVEIVKKIIDLHPNALSHVSHDDHNILHLTVKHRQKKIYELLKKYGALESLAAQMSNKGCTLLHHAAMMEHYNGGNEAGVVFQLQEELLLFKRVTRIIPGAFVLYRNDQKLTARELFELEHLDMFNEAQQWIKGTAQSCSAVAALVATVVFAAVYAVPGGYDEDGVPVLHKSLVFKFIIIMDAVALTSSLLSVKMFLDILTSPFRLQEFEQDLPRKLSSGFFWLFISLTATMLTFGSTIFITLGKTEMEWESFFVYTIMAFLFIFFKYITKKLGKSLKEIVPKMSIKSAKRTSTRLEIAYVGEH